MKYLLIIITLFFSSIASAFDLTSKPINVIIPFPPGGGVDATFKHLAKYAANHNIKLVPVYKSGADGLIGMNELSKSPKDGYHVSITTSGAIATYRLKNNDDTLKPLIGIRNSMSVVVVNSNSNIRTYDEYEYNIKNDPNFNFGFGAPGQRMLINQLIQKMKITNNPMMIPYKGGAQVVADLLGNHITSGILALGIVSSHIESESLRVIAINANNPPKQYVDIPLIQKKYPDWVDFDWFCLVLPTDTDIEIVNAWRNFMEKYLSDPQVLKEFEQEFTEPVNKDQQSAESTVKTFIEWSGVN